MSDRRTVHRVCPFCEATCGLAIEVEDNAIVSVRGDKEDPFSRGYICPKAHGLKELYHDPDRLRQPVRRTADGREEITWDEAYKEIASRLLTIREQYGNNAVGVYAGNPIVHDLGFLYLPPLIRALARRNAFNSEAIDTQDRPDRPDVGSQLRVVRVHAGVNTNALTDNQAYDEASGTAVLFGTPVTVEPLATRPD